MPDGSNVVALRRPVVATKIAWTGFPDRYAGSLIRHQGTLAELADALQKPVAAQKGDLPYVKLAEFGDDHTPITYDEETGRKIKGGSYRCDANVVAITGIEGDHDTGTITATEA